MFWARDAFRKLVPWVVMLAFLAIGCGRRVTEVKVGLKDSGSLVVLQVGQTLVIILESNPTTGYSWAVVDPPVGILQQKGEAEFKPSVTGSSPAVGAGGTETFVFEAKGAGKLMLEMAYRRPFEPDVAPLRTFSLYIEVR